MKEYVRDTEHYLGKDPKKLQDQLLKWLANQIVNNREAHVIIVISAHGSRKRRGAFEDSMPGIPDRFVCMNLGMF